VFRYGKVRKDVAGVEGHVRERSDPEWKCRLGPEGNEVFAHGLIRQARNGEAGTDAVTYVLAGTEGIALVAVVVTGQVWLAGVR